MDSETARKALLLLSRDVRDYWSCGAVPTVARISPLEFVRDFVSQNRPVRAVLLCLHATNAAT